MPTSQITTTWRHSNKYSADAECEHCRGVVRHQAWCITLSPTIFYAYQAVLDADKLSEGDRILLHGLGVAWTGNICAGQCRTAEG